MAGGGWTKLFASIVTSSLWCEDHSTVRVWIAMLATADAEGVVEGSIPGFANLARVTVPEMRAAVEKLSAPDPDSRTPDHEGRRIEVVEGGWQILNHAAYRARSQDRDGSKAPAMRRLRARRRAEREQVTEGNALLPEVTSDPEARSKKTETETATDVVVDDVPPGDVEATDDNGPRLVQCPRCKQPLRRERGLYPSEATGGKGWLCGPARASPGACGAVFQRDAPEILGQLSSGAREALDREIREEAAARRKLLEEGQRADELAVEFVEDARGRRYGKAPPDSAEALWQRVIDRLAADPAAMDPHSRHMWVDPTWGLQRDGPHLVVVVPNQSFVGWLSAGKYSAAIAAAGALELGPGFAVTYRPESEVLLERFDTWAKERKLRGADRLNTLVAIQRRLGVEAA